uniref:Activity-regulated cytoskeleton associated protein 2-like n=1 Tax=Diabrotica virgifera virgifera TaxID=50390 RepID=A0A6P7FRV3_DIAVI
MTTITMSADQFNELLRTVAASPGTNNSSGSFSKCTARFSGKRCHNTVETFITTVSIYKEIEKISEADALKGLPLLLTDNAAVWWQGVQNEAKTWNDATQLLRTAFSPSKPAHQLYSRDTNGEILHDKNLVLNRWVQHFSEHLNINDIEGGYHIGNQQNLHHQLHSEDPTREEVSNAILKLRENKAPGIDDICSEMFKKVVIYFLQQSIN